jgi:hypothetical protein
LDILMPSPRPFAYLAVTLVLGTGVFAGLQLTHHPAEPVPPPAPAAAPMTTVPTPLPAGPVAGPLPLLPTPAPAPAPAVAPAPVKPAPAPVVRRPAPKPQLTVEQRRQIARERLRQKAIAFCRKLGYSVEKCNTAPR